MNQQGMKNTMPMLIDGQTNENKVFRRYVHHLLDPGIFCMETFADIDGVCLLEGDLHLINKISMDSGHAEEVPGFIIQVFLYLV
jgi:hypothetical protein